MRWGLCLRLCLCVGGVVDVVDVVVGSFPSFLDDHGFGLVWPGLHVGPQLQLVLLPVQLRLALLGDHAHFARATLAITITAAATIVVVVATIVLTVVVLLGLLLLLVLFVPLAPLPSSRFFLCFAMSERSLALFGLLLLLVFLGSLCALHEDLAEQREDVGDAAQPENHEPQEESGAVGVGRVEVAVADGAQRDEAEPHGVAVRPLLQLCEHDRREQDPAQTEQTRQPQLHFLGAEAPRLLGGRDGGASGARQRRQGDRGNDRFS